MAAGSRRDGSRLRTPSAGAITTSGASLATTNGVARGGGKAIPDQRGDGRELVAGGIGCGPAGLAQVADVLHPGQRHPVRRGGAARRRNTALVLATVPLSAKVGVGSDTAAISVTSRDHSRSSTAGEPITPSGSTMPRTPPGASSRTDRARPATLGSIRRPSRQPRHDGGGGGHTGRVVVLALAERGIGQDQRHPSDKRVHSRVGDRVRHRPHQRVASRRTAAC